MCTLFVKKFKRTSFSKCHTSKTVVALMQKTLAVEFECMNKAIWTVWCIRHDTFADEKYLTL